MNYKVNIKITTPKGIQIPDQKYDTIVREFLNQIQKSLINEVLTSERSAQSFENVSETDELNLDYQTSLKVCERQPIPIGSSGIIHYNDSLQVHTLH